MRGTLKTNLRKRIVAQISLSCRGYLYLPKIMHRFVSVRARPVIFRDNISEVHRAPKTVFQRQTYVRTLYQKVCGDHVLHDLRDPTPLPPEEMMSRCPICTLNDDV